MDQFKQMYPGRANMRRLSITAIRWALRKQPKFLKRQNG